MAGTERNRAAREVLLAPLEKPLASLEELTDACLPTLTARLWATCCWSATMDGAWKIGDHNLLIAEVRPDPETCLYVQFWSEPRELVCAEVCSGEWNPGAVKYVRQPQRDRIGALGYTAGGEAGNFQKDLRLAPSMTQWSSGSPTVSCSRASRARHGECWSSACRCGSTAA